MNVDVEIKCGVGKTGLVGEEIGIQEKKKAVLMGWVGWWVFRFYAASVRSKILFEYKRFLRKVNPDL